MLLIASPEEQDEGVEMSVNLADAQKVSVTFIHTFSTTFDRIT